MARDQWRLRLSPPQPHAYAVSAPRYVISGNLVPGELNSSTSVNSPHSACDAVPQFYNSTLIKSIDSTFITLADSSQQTTFRSQIPKWYHLINALSLPHAYTVTKEGYHLKPTLPPLQPAITLNKNGPVLITDVISVEFLPTRTAFLHTAQAANTALDLVHALEELHAEAACNVERDVAVHEPSARIVRFKRQDEVAFGRQGRGVAADGVVHFESRYIAVPLRILFLG